MCGTSQIFCSNIFSCCRISNFHNEKRWKIKCSTCLSLWRGCEIVFWKDAKLKISQRAYSYSTEGRYQDRWSSWQGGGICPVETELTAHFDVQKKRCRKVIKPSTGLYMQEYIYFTDHLCRPLLIDVMNWESQPYLPGKLLQGYI